MTMLRAIAGLLRRLRPRPAELALFACLLGTELTYRLWLLGHLLRDPVTPFSFVPNRATVPAFLRSASYDLAAVIVASVLLALLARAVLGLSPAAWQARLRRAGVLAFGLLVCLLGLISAVHLRTMLAMHSGLDSGLIAEVFEAGGQRDLLDYAQPSDFVLLALPPLLFWLCFRASPRWAKLRDRSVLVLSVVCLALYFPARLASGRKGRPPRIVDALRLPPALYVARDAFTQLHAAPDGDASKARGLPPLPARGLFFDDEPGPAPPPAARPAQGAWNVLLVIMESTGARYAFDKKRAGEMPMPVLSDLARHGMYLARHYASANTSPRAIFSLFTGLYPEPMAAMFCTRPDIYVPGLGSLLGARYDRFFVTPGRLKSYLPLAMLNHQGIAEVFGYDELPTEHTTPMPGAGRNEVDTANFFLARLARAKPPFFATYYSYAPHYDYFDHGPEYRIIDDLSDPENRYYNNLRLLDTQIGRFIDALSKSGRLDDTIVLLVGDHGEGFGQHPGNFTHSRRSFEENLRVPAVLYQPQLFAAQRIAEPTTHADLLPTLLDAMGKPYDSHQLQGQSLLRGAPRRRYIYGWGNEGTLTSIDTQTGHKLHLSFKGDSCTAFDLNKDPHEDHEHECGPDDEPQFETALRYYAFQGQALLRYNDRLRKNATAHASR